MHIEWDLICTHEILPEKGDGHLGGTHTKCL